MSPAETAIKRVLETFEKRAKTGESFDRDMYLVHAEMMFAMGKLQGLEEAGALDPLEGHAAYEQLTVLHKAKLEACGKKASAPVQSPVETRELAAVGA